MYKKEGVITMPVTVDQNVTLGRTARIGLRATQKQHILIQRAAEILNKSVTEFILDSACRSAENTLLDRRYFLLDEEDWDKFNAALDRPAEIKPGLLKLLEEKAPWEE